MAPKTAKQPIKPAMSPPEKKRLPEGLSSEQIQQIKNAFKDYLSILRCPTPTNADVDHSSLLYRLLCGKAALPVPPPRALSYPWYDLLENGADTVIEEMVWEDGNNKLCINQNSSWSVVERTRQPQGYLVRYNALTTWWIRKEKGLFKGANGQPDRDGWKISLVDMAMYPSYQLAAASLEDPNPQIDGIYEDPIPSSSIPSGESHGNE